MRCDAFGKIDPMKWRPVLVHLRHRASQYGATIIATDGSEFSSLRECDAITAGITARNGRIFYEHLVAQIYGRTLPDKRGDDGGKALLCLSPGQDGGPDAFRHSLNVEDAEFLSRPIETFFDSDSDEERVREEEAQPVTTVDSMKVFLSRMAERMPAPMNAPSSPQTATTPVTNRSFFQNLLVKEPGSSARKGAPEVR
ncbi:hypothetical protein Pmar_PMAR005860 [Perkinsus marinus ATCC 50983]|uniref:Uncharacterized protein n=1 Tax=Perkinsus marinus (strain ATCC 50983 / TXsc) TaxID=423536 RepID=C5KYE8_PERM5|nr:hypothetical protein Pmar_PMAR005860 [Perkinsus marinus ATCC 50983]EER10525.1 hypothetical protein Pmar_PMAR005860 [Perkinsus marinus ATCC 50983]|eukprot:XP_002778730.1 hypothetical protein Pmar_PMAR005860 [Perkinsus marinus ATCC 50983]